MHNIKFGSSDYFSKLNRHFVGSESERERERDCMFLYEIMYLCMGVSFFLSAGLREHEPDSFFLSFSWI